MFLLLKFILTALWLIFISLIFPDFYLGNRYLILLEASLIVYLPFLIHNLFSKLTRNFAGLATLKQGLFGGTSVFIALFFIKWLFPMVNLTITGLLMTYLGVTSLEILFLKLEKHFLPDKNRIFRKVVLLRKGKG